VPREADRNQEPPAGTPWRVTRLDDNGNEFPVQGGLTRGEAETLARRFEASGHKQTYSVRRE